MRGNPLSLPTPPSPGYTLIITFSFSSQLFGEEDPAQDVLPDTEDPEAADTPPLWLIPWPLGTHWNYDILVFHSQLFGEEDPDQDVSPDTEDPEAAGDAGESALTSDAKTGAVGGIERKSTRQWAVDSGYHAQKIFTKVRQINQYFTERLSKQTLLPQ